MTPIEAVLAAAGKAAAQLSPEELARAFVFDLVTQAVPMLEQSRKAHQKTGEDGLTYNLLGYINAAYPGAARETDSSGHVDIALKHPVHLRIILSGEAKVICPKGFAWYEEGLTKLVSQYNNGRNELALFVCFCRYPDMYIKLEEYRQHIETSLVADYVTTLPLSDVGLEGQRGVFVTSHTSAGSRMIVVHVWINMCVQTDEQIIASAKQRAKERLARSRTDRDGERGTS